MTKLAILLILPNLAFGSIYRSDSVYQDIVNSVSQVNLQGLLKDMTGTNSVTVAGQTFNISNRYLANFKEIYRAYWKSYFESLGLKVNDLPYYTNYTKMEPYGHNVEAVLPGRSPDSIIVIVHYDSIGPAAQEDTNPGVDDDMTGMAIMMETARILVPYQARLKYTIRFVAADYEEWGDLEGARNYVKYIQNLATAQNFKIVASVDDEQSGWNCVKDGKCKDGATTPKFLVNDCSKDGKYDYSKMGKFFEDTVSKAVSYPLVHECAGQDSDHYAMWEAGIPAIEWGEFSWQTNDHFDGDGGDTYDKIDQEYFFQLAKGGVLFTAVLAGVDD